MSLVIKNGVSMECGTDNEIKNPQSFVEYLESRANDKSMTAYLMSANLKVLHEIAYEVAETGNTKLIAKIANLVSNIRRNKNIKLDGETDDLIWAFSSKGLVARKRNKNARHSIDYPINSDEIINLDKVLNLLKTLSQEELMIVSESCSDLLAER